MRLARWVGNIGRFAPLIALTTAAALLRFHDLGLRSLWLDEIDTAQVVRLPDAGSVISYVMRDPSATPLTYLITWLFRPLGGDELAIRLPYATAGLLAVLAMYALAERLYGRGVGLVAGLLFATLPYAIFYSQEARSYAFLMLFTTLMMLAAHRAVTVGRPRDWAFLSVLAALDLYTGYLAIAVVLAAYAYVGLVVSARAIGAARGRRLPGTVNALTAAMRPAFLSGLLMAALYAPWFGRLRALLENPDQGFGRATPGIQPTIGEAQALLAQLDLHGIVFWLVVAGIARGSIEVARGRRRRPLLGLTWLVVPLLGFAAGAGGGLLTIWPRYFGAVYPAAILVAAMGVDGLSRVAVGAIRGVTRAVREREFVAGNRLGDAPSAIRILAIALLCGFVGLDALPADAASYVRPKGSDYRGAVDAILRADHADPVVLVVGPNPDWTVSGLSYYGWVRGSRLTVVDALKVNVMSMRMLKRATSVWAAALISPSVPSPTEAFSDDAFGDFSLLRATAASDPVGQARAVLDWAASFESEATATSRLMDVLLGHGSVGDELMPRATESEAETSTPPVDRWILQPGASLTSDGAAFRLEPQGRSTNVYLTKTSVRPGLPYVLSFSCAASHLTGSANVFVVADRPSGPITFPDGAGYSCAATSDSEEGVFAFTMPSAASSITIWLRATGSGSVRYSEVSLRPLE